MPDPDVTALIADGRLAEAAAQLEAAGDCAGAASLHERLWDHAAAARCAEAAGDLPRALLNRLRGEDALALEALVARLEQGPHELAARGARIAGERGAWAIAGRLHRAAEESPLAAECFERAGELLRAAELRDARGEGREALRLYRRALARDVAPADLGDDELSTARLATARLCLTQGQAADAIPLLQTLLAAGGPLALPAGLWLVAALSRLGYTHAADGVLERLRASGAEVPARSRDCADLPELAIQTEADARTLAGRYRLGQLLGAGGMGRVYRAEDLLLGRPVAVKLFTAPAGARGREAFLRFVREARIAGTLDHPHVVPVLDFQEATGFMVLELMSGGTLADRLRPRLSPGTCRSILLQVLAGLEAAHQRGIVHRDLKPSNVFFTEAGAAKLGDFGVAHLQDAGQTQTGSFVGTLAFMAPEQLAGGAVTFATDLYALGVMLYQALTGELPFTGPALLSTTLRPPPVAPSARVEGLPQICDRVVLTCLAADPAARFASLEELRRAIEAFPTDPPARPTPATPTEGAPPLPQRPARATDARFHVEQTRASNPALQLLEARDTQLGRAVVLVRLAPGPARERLLALLSAAAQATEELQRVLGLDSPRGQAVLEPWVGRPWPPLASSHARLDAALAVSRALASLHRAGLGHGALSRATLALGGRDPRVALVPSLERWAAVCTSEHPEVEPTPQADLAAVATLLELDLPAGLSDGAALAAWAASEQERLAADEQAAWLARALSDAPPSVRRH
ncbi:MAG: serine/threonine protein kinase [Deltaproteobacteria bacterium]|nr:serine/threonine protein kinase [Deltaproteobacteria bacterium]